MKHRVTHELFDYWDALRRGRPAPDRSDLDPGAIRACLADTFLLVFDPDRGPQFRIAGTAICAMFGYELSLTSFDRLWAVDDRRVVDDLVRAVADDAGPAVAHVIARNTEDETAELEMILLPLTPADGDAGRLLGGLSPVTAPYWLGTRPLRKLHIGARRHLRRNGMVMRPQTPPCPLRA